jgi:hypothetical protein
LDQERAPSTIVASQLPVQHWRATISDAHGGQRHGRPLVRNSTKIVLKGESIKKANHIHVTATVRDEQPASLGSD